MNADEKDSMNNFLKKKQINELPLILNEELSIKTFSLL